MGNTFAIFDFDGTITRKDTLLEFIKFAKGQRAFYIGFLYHILILIAYKLRLYPNWKAKQRIFTYFFGGMFLTDFNVLCEKFFVDKGKRLLYSSAVTKIQEYYQKGDEVVIISASIENWIQPFSRYLGVKCVIGTKLEIDEHGRLTGCFLTPNCYGQEKVRRFLECFPNQEECYVVAYGDSRGDKELLAWADEKYYKLFQK